MISALIVSLTVLTACEAPAGEQERIRQHLLRTEAELRAHPPSGLNPQQLAARGRNLDTLHAYALAGTFPLNPLFEEPTPYFIDERGTRCAMAALIETSGAADLVQRVAATANNAYVRELAGDAELVAWLRANGLTADEAARIQPTYVGCWERRRPAVCSGESLPKVLATFTGYSNGTHLARIDEVLIGRGVDAGTELTVTSFARIAAVLPPDVGSGYRVFGSISNGKLYAHGAVNAAGEVYSPNDRRCASYPRVRPDRAAHMMNDGGSSCAAELDSLDPAWSQRLCVDELTGFGDQWQWSDFCLEDGGVDPCIPQLPDGGTRATKWGVSQICGAPPIAKPDAGAAAIDAGEPPRATEPSERTGCSSAPAAALAVIAVAFVARRRASKRR